MIFKSRHCDFYDFIGLAFYKANIFNVLTASLMNCGNEAEISQKLFER